MARLKFLIICAFVMLNVHEIHVSALLNITEEALNFGNNLIYQIWNESTYKTEYDIKNKIKDVNSLLFEMAPKISEARDSISQFDKLDFFRGDLTESQLLKIHDDMKKFRETLSKILEQSTGMIKYYTEFPDRPQETLIDLCEIHKCEIFKSVLENMFEVLEEKKMIEHLDTLRQLPHMTDIISKKTFLDIVRTSSTTYGWALSKQQTLLNLLNVFAVAEATAYSMMQYSFAVLQIYSNASPLLQNDQKSKIEKITRSWGEDNIIKSKMLRLRESFIYNNTDTLKTFKSAMMNTPRKLESTDKVYISNNHIQLRNVFQKYVINEGDLNPDNSCKRTCPDYNQAKIYGCYDGGLCAQQRKCYGNLWECNDKPDGTMRICPTDQPEFETTIYDFVEINGQQYGNKGKCHQNVIEPQNWPRGFYKCSFCMCTCDNAYMPGERYINLRSTTSDLDSNYIITDARFAKTNDVIHIQIKQGKLLPNGIINRTTEHWKALDNYTISNEYTVNGIDYHIITWNERGVLLDKLDTPTNHVITGLKFSVKSGYLRLQMRSTQFNFITGELGNSHWISSPHMDSDLSIRTEIQLNNVDENIPTSSGHKYLRFTTSNFKLDAGQSTIPYIDTQALNTIAIPFSGVDLVHKSIKNVGHFLALEFQSYDFIPHLK